MTKIFGTDGIRCLVNHEPLTAETCLKISKSIAFVLKKKTQDLRRAVICKDTRLSGYLYEPLVTAGFISMGMDVILVGPLPTPAVPLLIRTLRADLGVMITASHNTYEYNGLKFFDHKGVKLSSVIEKKVEKIISDNKKYSKITNNINKLGKAKRLEDASGRYSEFLKRTLLKVKRTNKLKIILDCANGATYNIAPNLFWELGHKVISINNKPDGININQKCGAVDTNELSKHVLKNDADIGFAFDGDGDRLIVIDEKGNEVDGDKIIALFSKHFVSDKNKFKNKNIVITKMSNMGLEMYLRDKLGLVVRRTDVGDINVIRKMKTSNALLGGEQSGHIIFSEYANTGDGILAALKITEILTSSKIKTSSMFNLYKDYEQKKINIKYSFKNKNLIKSIDIINKSKLFNSHNIRTLVRFSGTEPLIRILVEGKDKDIVKKNFNKINSMIRKCLD